MSGDLIKQQEIKAPSFQTRNRATKQIELIVSLLITSLEAGVQITSEDIVRVYVDWKIANGDKLLAENYYHDWQERGLSRAWKYEEVTREQFENRWGTKGKARQWFKSNLGAAIISGKILAIPVIEL